MIKGERWLDGLDGLDLTVIEMKGWKRAMRWPDGAGVDADQPQRADVRDGPRLSRHGPRRRDPGERRTRHANAVPAVRRALARRRAQRRIAQRAPAARRAIRADALHAAVDPERCRRPALSRPVAARRAPRDHQRRGRSAAGRRAARAGRAAEIQPCLGRAAVRKTHDASCDQRHDAPPREASSAALAETRSSHPGERRSNASGSSARPT